MKPSIRLMYSGDGLVWGSGGTVSHKYQAVCRVLDETHVLAVWIPLIAGLPDWIPLIFRSPFLKAFFAKNNVDWIKINEYSYCSAVGWQHVKGRIPASRPMYAGIGPSPPRPWAGISQLDNGWIDRHVHTVLWEQLEKTDKLMTDKKVGPDW